MHGTVPIERCSTPPSTRRSLSSAGALRRLFSYSGFSRSAPRRSVGIALATEGAEAFNGNRLAAPTGYENASAALFLMAFWPAVALAARPEVHWAARSLLLAAGGLLLQLALLAQSRGSLVAGGVALLVLVLVSRDRLRLLAVLLLVSAAVAATLVPLLDLVAAGSEAEVRRAVGAERVAVVLSTAALFLVGALVFFVGQTGRVRRGLPQLTARGRVVAVVALCLALAAFCAVAASTLGDAPRPGLETGRYDMWRVAAAEVAEHPLLGVGVDNFAVDFARERSTGEEPLYPHSLASEPSLRPASSAACSSSPSWRRHLPLPCPVERSQTRSSPPSPRLRLPPASTGSCTARSTGCGRFPRSGPPRSPSWGWPPVSPERSLA